MSAPGKATFTPSDKMDIEKFRKAVGFTTTGSARACWLSVKKRLIAHAHASAKNRDDTEGNGDAGPAVRKASAKKVTAAGKKRKASETTTSAHVSNDDDDDDSAEMSPSKKAAIAEEADGEAAAIKSEQDEIDNHSELADTFDWNV
ncbi:hypothetical protein PG999_014606 [Apiospora kogelbergensis]|uniref:Uncharacterized protein n=1 Tax=Apiospora kogelbergensis TaxID=1337665 RepID=A0AAW0Q3Q8_9PEZI